MMPMFLTRRELFAGSIASLVVATRFRYAGAAEDDALARGRGFLVGLFDEELSLLPEFRGCERYWLYHDNYLAALALATSHPELARRIRAAIAGYGVTKSGKIEIVLGEARDPLPFRTHELIDVKRLGDKVIKTEILGERELQDWREYADLLLLAAIEKSRTDHAAGRALFEQAIGLWDGSGFRDRVVESARQYATFKCALAVLAASRLEASPTQMPAILERLREQQRADGGWITDYDLAGEPVGEANVETTSLALLALDAWQNVGPNRK